MRILLFEQVLAAEAENVASEQACWADERRIADFDVRVNVDRHHDQFHRE